MVVITGGSAGVGRATARVFAERGAAVAVIARDSARLRATNRELGALTIAADVADPEAIEHAADAIERALGPIDVWINNAMTSVFAELVDITPQEYRRVTDVVYHGTVYGTMAALHRMLPRDRGRIVLVGSALAYRGIPLQSAYCGAKHAVLGMFESLRSELLHQKSNVTVSMVQLPAMNTPQFEWCRSKLPRRSQPVPPIFQPEVAAHAIEHVARTGRRELWVGLPTMKAIVGDRIAPGLLDRYLARTGYRAQQTDEPADPQQPDNLFDAAPGDWAAHGRFDARAHTRSPATWLARHRTLTWSVAITSAVALTWGLGAMLRARN